MSGTDERRIPVSNPTPRRAVRLFVAVHVAGVAAIYGIALVIGGGWGAGVLPLPSDTQRSAASKPAAARHAVAQGGQHTPATAQALPGWTQRVEVAAPWEVR